MTHVCVFVEKPLGNFDRDRFCFGFKAQLSGAKFYDMNAHRAPSNWKERARGQERRCEDVKMRGCEDVKMRG